MKQCETRLVLVALTLFLASAAAAYTGSYVPGTGIDGGVHDLPRGDNGMGYTPNPDDALKRICIYCHAPHNTYRLSPANDGPGTGSGPQAPDAYDYLPLWNHDITANYPFYTMYQNGPGAPQSGRKASQAILGGGMEPGGVSLLCLSCHDGSITVNSYGNTSQPSWSRSTGGSFIATRYVIGAGNYLGNHHPIGFNYDFVQGADLEIRAADAASFTATDTVRDHLYGPSSSTMECATCHSVHNTGNRGESLLWRSNQNSELCLTCHDKGTYIAP